MLTRHILREGAVVDGDASKLNAAAKPIRQEDAGSRPPWAQAAQAMRAAQKLMESGGGASSTAAKQNPRKMAPNSDPPQDATYMISGLQLLGMAKVERTKKNSAASRGARPARPKEEVTARPTEAFPPLPSKASSPPPLEQQQSPSAVEEEASNPPSVEEEEESPRRS